MTKSTIERNNQQITDFKELYLRDRIDNIHNQELLLNKIEAVLVQTTRHNGRMTKIETKQEECPARESYKKGKPLQYTVQIITIVIAGLAFFYSVII